VVGGCGTLAAVEGVPRKQKQVEGVPHKQMEVVEEPLRTLGEVAAAAVLVFPQLSPRRRT
jgi:hypothetical protein